MNKLSETIEALNNRRMSVMLLLGFSSGLPLALSGGTLQAWLATTSIDIKTIAIFSLVGLPYTLKFIWAPIMDRFIPPAFGRRRGWILITQGMLIGLILAIAASDPDETVFLVGLFALAIAFFSASQDIAIDAYRADLLKPEERGFGSALSVVGYRIAMLTSGALALIFADNLGWQTTYCIMAGILLIGVVTTLFSPEPGYLVEPPKNLQDAVIEPFKEFASRSNFVWLLVLIVMYKLGDAFAGTLTTTFLIRGLEFSLTDVGVVNKGMGLLAGIGGVLLGGGLMFRYGLFRCLLWFGILQAITNLGFMILAMIGKSYIGMVIVIAMEQIAGGMGTATFLALLISLCDHRYTATQFALFSALSAVGRVFIGPPSGVLVDALGWTHFFLITFFVAIPGIVLLVYLRKTIEGYHDTSVDNSGTNQ